MKAGSERLIIVIPTYNEVPNIKELIDKIRKYVCNCGLLIMDDNSPDGTAEIVKEMQGHDKNIYLIQRERKLGLASAMITGFKWGLNNGYEYLCEMDADLSHNPKYLTELIEKINEYDFVIGSRNIPGGGVSGWPLKRKILSKLGNFYARIFLSIPIYDLTGGFNMWRRQVLEDIDLDSMEAEGYGFLIEMKYKAYKKRFSFKEVPIIFEDRIGGVSKISKNIIFEAVWKVPLFRFKF